MGRAHIAKMAGAGSTMDVPLGASRTQTHKPSGGCVACVLIRPCASRRDTRRERDATCNEHHSPAMPFAHTARARDGTRDRARGGFESRVVVVVSSSVVRLGSPGTTPIAATSRKRGARFRVLVMYDLKRTRSPLLRTCLVAFLRDDGTERRPGTCEHFRCWVVHELPWAGLLIIGVSP